VTDMTAMVTDRDCRRWLALTASIAGMTTKIRPTRAGTSTRAVTSSKTSALRENARAVVVVPRVELRTTTESSIVAIQAVRLAKAVSAYAAVHDHAIRTIAWRQRKRIT
jgi:hypothetical protein